MLGRGGVPDSPQSSAAAGVIGLAGGEPIPNISETGNTGVYGAGPTGVRGQGHFGRGGMFQSDRSAQVQLVPQKVEAPLPAPVTVTPTAIPTEDEGPKLPKDGRAGDLLALLDNQRQCTLWFCVEGDEMNRARWAQVLLGKPFLGQV